MRDEPVTLAAIVGAHGVKGEVRLKLFTDDLSPYPTLDGGGRTFTLKSVRVGSNGAVARFAEISDRDTAEAMRGTALTVPRSALPPLAEGEFYHADLIGLPCLVDGVEIGRVVAIDNFGASDVLEIEKENGKRFMIPISAANVGEDRLDVDPVFVE